MKKLMFMIGMFFTSVAMISQVGAGTTDPGSMLDIVTTNTGIPAMKLAPQSNPVGSQTGHIAVIGDDLFVYDANRVKWLSISSSALKWIYDDPLIGVTDEELNYAFGYEEVVADVGAVMPFDGTIVYGTASYKQTSGGTKNFGIYIEDAITEDITLEGSLATSDFKGAETDMNIDFNARDIIRIKLGSGGEITAPIVILWVKRRE